MIVKLLIFCQEIDTYKVFADQILGLSQLLDIVIHNIWFTVAALVVSIVTF